MARALQTEFQKFEPETEDERRAMLILPASNVQFIQTQLAILMEERAVFTYDHTDLPTSIQQEAGLLGQITAYRYLLTCHQAALEERKQLNQESQ